jgi:transcriptional regulator GlxA family with amidase domain
MQIVIYVYDGMTALDAVGPYDIWNRIPGTSVLFAGTPAGLKRTSGGLGLQATHKLSETPQADVLLVPGGGASALVAQMHDTDLLSWIRAQHAGTTWTTSVCTGALILGAAGILDGRRATTHWRASSGLARFGAEHVDQRYIEDGKIITSAGVSAGIDMALALAAKMHGTDLASAVQLSAHYDPQPPLAPLTPHTAPDSILALIETLGPE